MADSNSNSKRKTVARIYMTDAGYEKLKNMAYDLGYVRGPKPEDRPRGLSAFVMSLTGRVFVDARPGHWQETDLWYDGENTVPRTLDLTPSCIEHLALQARRLHIWPYRRQRAILNGYRDCVTRPPVVYPLDLQPKGAISVVGLVGPLLEALAQGYLKPSYPLTPASPTLYRQPSRHYATRDRPMHIQWSD